MRWRELVTHTSIKETPRGNKRGTPPLDLTGQIFGKLKAVRMVQYWDKGSRVWECFCLSCGDTTYFSANDLRRGAYKACGCQIGQRRTALAWRKDLNNFDTGPRPKTLGQVRKDYKQGAKVRNLTFNLTDEEIDLYVLGDCYYCGKIAEPYNGIDRIDSSLGYHVDNVVPCCETCNRMKQAMHRDEFLKQIVNISRELKLWQRLEDNPKT